MGSGNLIPLAESLKKLTFNSHAFFAIFQLFICNNYFRLGLLQILIFNFQDSFHFLRLIVDYELPPDYYTKDMKGILADGKLISEILQDKCSRLADHLRKQGNYESWLMNKMHE